MFQIFGNLDICIEIEKFRQQFGGLKINVFTLFIAQCLLEELTSFHNAPKFTLWLTCKEILSAELSHYQQ